MLIAVPSKGRAGNTTTQNVVASGIFFVPESEMDDYNRSGVKAVIPVPNDIRGITRTRNWILKNQNDKRVVFLDDDCQRIGWAEMLDENVQHHHLPESVVLVEFTKLFEITEALHYRIWGASTISASRAVYPQKPFLFRTYVVASCMGVVNTGIRFDESYQVKEDYELCLRCIVEDGGIVGARYFYCESAHWTIGGGCAEYRTQEMEADAIARLIKTYPGLIRQVKRGGSQFSVALDFPGS